MSLLSYVLAGFSLLISLGSGAWVRPSIADVSTTCFTHGTTLPPMVDGNESTRWSCCHADIGLSSADVHIVVPGSSQITALKARFHCTTSWTLKCSTTGAFLTNGSGPNTDYEGGCHNGWVEKEFPSASCGAMVLSMTQSQNGTCHGIYDLQYQTVSVPGARRSLAWVPTRYCRSRCRRNPKLRKLYSCWHCGWKWIAPVTWKLAPRDCQTCDEVCALHGQVCEVGHLTPIRTESEVTRIAKTAGFTCTHFHREHYALVWDGPLLGMYPGFCVYNGYPGWKPSCSARPACGYGKRICPCAAAPTRRLSKRSLRR